MNTTATPLDLHPLNPSTAIATDIITPQSDSLLTATLHNELALSCGFDIDFYLKQNSEEATSTSESSDIAGTEFLFSQQTSSTLFESHPITKTVTAVDDVLINRANGDFLTGINQDNSLVSGNSSGNFNTSNGVNGSIQGNGNGNGSTSVDAGNSVSTATTWAALNGGYAYSESIGGSDTNDYFQFSLTTGSNFSLVMSGLSADADVRLLDQSGNQILSSVNADTHKIGGNAFSVSTSEAFNTTLNAGTYFLHVNSYDGQQTQYKMNFLTKPTTSTSDWYSQNLKDSGLINWTRQLANDGQLSRNDMMLLFRSTTDNGTVDSQELADLRTIVNNSGRFQMADYVKNLSSKVAFGHSANALYQGQDGSPGNLVAGSSAGQLDKLIGKWFLGNDLPSTSVPAKGDTPARTITYGLASTSGLSGRNQVLFGKDSSSSGINISHTDIRQGYMGDCYFLASLGAFAKSRSSVINNMFIDNGDGTFTVRFYGQNNGTVTTGADYVTVNQYLPTNVNPGGGFASYDNQNTGLWVALAEKAYAQFAEIGTAQRPTPSNNYGSIEGGWGFQVMNALTGVTQGGFYSDLSKVGGATPKGKFLSLSSIASRLNLGWALSADTIQNPGLGIVGSHEYVIVSANTANGTLTLYNPWGSTPKASTTKNVKEPGEGETNGFRTISYNDFKANFNIINVG
ncbi:MAG: C2 family cysteine protease [Cyanobacteriota bacterium]